MTKKFSKKLGRKLVIIIIVLFYHLKFFDTFEQIFTFHTAGVIEKKKSFYAYKKLSRILIICLYIML